VCRFTGQLASAALFAVPLSRQDVADLFAAVRSPLCPFAAPAVAAGGSAVDAGSVFSAGITLPNPLAGLQSLLSGGDSPVHRCVRRACRCSSSDVVAVVQ
jgi:hypothetical protein